MAVQWRGQPLRAVLWDLDGTLIDTAGDIATALNRAFADVGYAAVAEQAVRTMIGRGAPMLISRALALQGLAVHEATRDTIFERFLVQYEALQEEGGSTAVAYPGALEALSRLRQAGVHLACVTNKHSSLAISSLEHAGLLAEFELVVGGDTCARRKPAPDPLQHACRVLGVPVGEALMVGDSLNDVLAARAAPMPVVCVPYGYNEGRDPRGLDCDARVETLAELPALLGLAAQGNPRIPADREIPV
jgi:phosphoglycolate phosphatase